MSTILAAVNIFLCLIVIYSQHSYISKNKNITDKQNLIIRKLLMFMGIYWGFIYTYVILSDLNIIPPIDPIYFGKVFVRPANTLLFGLIAASSLESLLRVERIKKEINGGEGLIDDDK